MRDAPDRPDVRAADVRRPAASCGRYTAGPEYALYVLPDEAGARPPTGAVVRHPWDRAGR
ncbi:hypothetical protein [Streptomyces umbrinus]|uniref:hypothetical protein n=1 Tax=Streptomyces umbrinus TaxID=67370 RepID=UPI003253D064